MVAVPLSAVFTTSRLACVAGDGGTRVARLRGVWRRRRLRGVLCGVWHHVAAQDSGADELPYTCAPRCPVVVRLVGGGDTVLSGWGVVLARSFHEGPYAPVHREREFYP